MFMKSAVTIFRKITKFASDLVFIAKILCIKVLAIGIMPQHFIVTLSIST